MKAKLVSRAKIVLHVARHGRPCADHPRLPPANAVFEAWMLATRASMTAVASL
jgi:hypothetical protein